MRTISTALGALSLAFLVTAPAVLAQVPVGPTDLNITDAAGKQLRYVPRSEIVRLAITVTNTGSTTVNDTITLRIVIERGTTTVYDQTIRRGVSIPPGETALIEQSWPPQNRALGQHVMTVAVQNSNEAPRALEFEVAESAVVAGSFGERLASYGWFVGLFALVLILFVVVLSSRRA